MKKEGAKSAPSRLMTNPVFSKSGFAPPTDGKAAGRKGSKTHPSTLVLFFVLNRVFVINRFLARIARIIRVARSARVLIHILIIPFIVFAPAAMLGKAGKGRAKGRHKGRCVEHKLAAGVVPTSF